VLEIEPQPDDQELAALRDALARLEIRPDAEPGVYRSGWRRAAVLEAVKGVSPPGRYALSPRRTRGATRA
jgi:hypothetical protein